MFLLTRRMLLSAFAAIGVLPATAARAARDFGKLPPDKRAGAEASYRKMMAALPYERVTVPGAKAYEEWQRLKGAARGWPIIVGSDDDLERIAETYSIDDETIYGPIGVALPKPRSPAEILRAAEAIRFPTDLAKWDGAYRAEDLTAPIGDWPNDGEVEEGGLTISTDILTGKPLDRVHILLIPAKASWEVPAYLRWGNWNACPPAEYHVAALRRWHERFGAELVAINGDTMNLIAARRPRSRADALALAREQYGYCPDIIDQGVTTQSALAKLLMDQPWWFFWWD